MFSFILNFPYTFVLLIAGIACVPESIMFRTKPYVIIVKVKKLWWNFLFHRHARAMASGNTILLGPHVEKHDLEHELIHVRQHEKLPFLYPIFYYFETFKHGYKSNKYESEAYTLSRSEYREK